MAKQRANRGRPPAKKAKKASKPRPADTEGPRKPTRAERWEAERRAKRRRSSLIRTAAGIVVGALVIGVVAWQFTSRRNAQRTISAMTTASCDYDTRSDRGAVNEHTSSPSFSVNPPAGGVHSPSAARAGTYTAESAPEDGQVVHALEHGFIAVSYRPDLAPEDVAELEELAEDYDEDVLLLPRPNLDMPVAATAWHRRLLCQQPEPANLRRFVEAYKGDGPENVPRS